VVSKKLLGGTDDPGIEGNPVNGVGTPLQRRKGNLVQPILLIEGVCTPNFFPIVVLGSHPEEGKDWTPKFALETFCQRCGRQPLIQAVEGSPEESWLLTSSDHAPTFFHEGSQPFRPIGTPAGKRGGDGSAILSGEARPDLPCLATIRFHLSRIPSEVSEGLFLAAEPGFDEGSSRKR
jgi:hypothetical protein